MVEEKYNRCGARIKKKKPFFILKVLMIINIYDTMRIYLNITIIIINMVQ